MPKEITHWILADRLKRILPPDSLFFRPVRRYPQLFLTGAVAPDTPYNYAAGPRAEKIQCLSNPLHGIGSSCLSPVLDLLKKEDGDEVTLAFSAGVVSHIMADTAFHPLVGYYSGLGGIHAGANTRHRLIETGMDYFFIRDCSHDYSKSLFRMTGQMEIGTDQLLDLMGALFRATRTADKRFIRGALHCHRFFQYLFRSRSAYRIFHFFHTRGLMVPSRVDALFYPVKLGSRIRFFEQEFTYQDPYTGEKCRSTMDRLAVSAVDNAARVLDIIEQSSVVQGGNNPVKGQVLNHPDLPLIRPGYSKERFQWVMS